MYIIFDWHTFLIKFGFFWFCSNRLVIQSVGAHDGGIYTLTATNNQGTTVANVKLNLHGMNNESKFKKKKN